MSKTHHRTPVAQLVLGFSSIPKGYAARCAVGLLGAAALGLPMTSMAQAQLAPSPGAPAPAAIAPSKLDPVLTDPAALRTMESSGAQPTFPRTAPVRNNQAAFDRMVMGSSQAAQTRASAQANPSVPWVLGASAHPWPLQYYEPISFSNLVLRVPAERDARIMLPGVAADEAEHARFTANKFVVDAIGLGAQARGRQLEEINTWITRTKEQLKSIDADDPWQLYQFSQEAHGHLKEFQAKVKAQSEPSIAAMADQIRKAIEQISPVMSVTESYELRMAWYNIMVLLKEGLTLYQSQLLGADQQIQDQIEAFIREHPPVARPEGPLPLTPEEAQAKKAAAAATLAPVAVESPKDDRTPAAAPSAADQSSSLSGGLIVALVSLLTGGGLFFAIRRRISRKKPGATATP